jgi:hypothetical protein
MGEFQRRSLSLRLPNPKRTTKLLLLTELHGMFHQAAKTMFEHRRIPRRRLDNPSQAYNIGGILFHVLGGRIECTAAKPFFL